MLVESRLKEGSIKGQSILWDEEHAIACDEIDSSDLLGEFSRWNRDALSELNQVSEPYRSQQRLLGSMMSSHITNGTLIDLGCGNGRTHREFLRYSRGSGSFRIIALDPDEAAVASAARDAAREGFDGELIPICGSTLVPLPVLDHEVDGILSGLGGLTYAFAHIDREGGEERILTKDDALNEVLSECARALKPGGVLGLTSLQPDPDFSEITKSTVRELLDAGRIRDLVHTLRVARRVRESSEFMRDGAESGNFHYLSIRDWRERLENAGFELLDEDCSTYANQGLALVARLTH